MIGKHQQAISFAQKAKSLDPLTPIILRRLVYAYFYKGDYQRALEAIEDALITTPDNRALLNFKGRVALVMGKNEEALLIANKMPDYPKAIIEAMAYSKMGDKIKSNEALAILIKRGAHDSAYQIAEVYCFRGETEQCLDWLETAYKQKDPGLVRLKIDPFLKPVSQENRFKELVSKIFIP